jgi:hypothetical protein
VVALVSASRCTSWLGRLREMGPPDNGYALFTLASNPSSTAVTVGLALSDGTATGCGVDYGAGLEGSTRRGHDPDPGHDRDLRARRHERPRPHADQRRQYRRGQRDLHPDGDEFGFIPASLPWRWRLDVERLGTNRHQNLMHQSPSREAESERDFAFAGGGVSPARSIEHLPRSMIRFGTLSTEYALRRGSMLNGYAYALTEWAMILQRPLAQKAASAPKRQDDGAATHIGWRPRQNHS